MIKKITLYLFIPFLSFSFKVYPEVPIDSILSKAMNAAEIYSEKVEEYEANIYMRVYVETLKKNFLYRYTHLIPKFVLHDKNANQGLLEVLSDLTYTAPNYYTVDVKYINGTFSQNKMNEMLPSSLIHLNIYNEMSSNERFLMPLRKSALKYYTYKLQRTFTLNNTTYYTISFTPIYRVPTLLKGSFILEKDSWRVKQFMCEGVDFVTDFSIELDMGHDSKTNLLPINAVIHQKMSYLGNVITHRSLVDIDYNKIVLTDNKPKPKNLNISNLYKIRLDSVPIRDDFAFWEKKRRIPLQAKEIELLDQYHIKQFEKQFIASKDSIHPKKNGTPTWAKNMVMNSRYKYRSTDISYSGVFNPTLLGYSSLDGLTYGQKLNVNFELKKQSNLDMKVFVGYMFRRRELFSDFTTTWNYNPENLGRLRFSVGNGNRTYSSTFIKEIQDSLKNKGLKVDPLDFDYYKDYYFKLLNTIEVINGLTIGTGLDFHIRDVNKNKINTSGILASIDKIHTENIVKMFRRRNTFAPVIALTWTPEQYYRYERRQKIYVRSPFPTVKLEFSKGIKGVLSSESQYNRIELDISQNIQLGLMQSFQYHVGMGAFSKQKTEYFADFAFFAKRNFPETWDDGIGGVFNLLDRQFYNASDSYLQTHFMYETPFLILNLVPSLSKGVVKERTYLSYLYNPYIRSYTELGYGFGNNYFNAAIFGSFHKLKFDEIGFKISLNILK